MAITSISILLFIIIIECAREGEGERARPRLIECMCGSICGRRDTSKYRARIGEITAHYTHYVIDVTIMKPGGQNRGLQCGSHWRSLLRGRRHIEGNLIGQNYYLLALLTGSPLSSGIPGTKTEKKRNGNYIGIKC